MFQTRTSRFRKFSATCLVIIIIGLGVSSTGKVCGQTETHQSEAAFEIAFPGESKPIIRMSAGSSTLIDRRRLNISDPSEAGEFTAIDVQTRRYADGINIRLAIIYNDLSNQEWWKDKKERLVGSYVIRFGETLRALELNQFGIEPVDMRAIDAGPIAPKPGEGPRVVNNSTALEVARLERRLDSYSIWLKNISSRNVVSYTISSGRNGQSVSSGGRGAPVIAAGATTREVHLFGPSTNLEEITISSVIFDDGTFEGDPNIAVHYLARAEGLRIQAPSVLLRIDQTLAVDDSELVSAFDKTEAELWLIHEAIDKQSALEHLKIKFPAFDEKTWSALYEELKGGLYDARNIALREMGDSQRTVRERQQRTGDPSVKLLRATLERVKEELERISSGKL